MSRAFSYIAMICGAIASVLFGILAAFYTEGNTHLYLCIAVTAMEFIFIRFNLMALRSNQSDRLLVVNNGAILILFASLAYFIRVLVGSFPMWLDIIVGVVAGIYAVLIILFYVINSRKNSGRLT